MSIIDEKVNRAIDGLEEIVEADEHSERLLQNNEGTFERQFN